MIHSVELNKSYESKDLLFKDLREKKEEIIDLKKAQILKSCDKGLSVIAKPIASKVIKTEFKNFSQDDKNYYIAVNSTKLLDSHRDLHLDGIWDRTAKEQQGKNYLVADHELKMGSVIARKEYITMFVAEVSWSALGKDYEGNTEVLVYQIPKDKIICETSKEWLESGDDIEASVRMQYVNIKLALDSNEKGDEEEKKEYDKYYPMIANKDEFESIYYFWTVYEAKNVRESSLVLFGSNHGTGRIKDIEVEAETITSTKTDADTITSEKDGSSFDLSKAIKNLQLNIK